MQAVTTLVGTLASTFIPGDYTLKSLCGQTITQGLNSALQRVTGDSDILSRLPFVKRKREVILNPGSPMFEKFEEYITRTYIENFHSCLMITKRGEISYGLSDGKFSTIREDHGGHDIFIEIANSDVSGDDGKKKRIDKICITSKTATMKDLRDYVGKICDFKNSSINVIKIYRASIEQTGGSRDKDKDKDETCVVTWEELNIKTNKTMINTILSEDNEKILYDDVEKFMRRDTERWYAEKGIPYKRGYVLHGPSGTGKTSVIKAIANRFSMDVFIIDMSIVTKDEHLCRLMSMVSYTAHNKPHIVALEDIDRSPMFTNNYRDDRRKISMNTFLNAIDGVIEAFGRILIVTANDISPLKMIDSNALLRPGRIDKIVLLDKFGESDTLRMVSRFYGVEISEDRLNLSGKRMCPADIVNVMQSHPDDMESALLEMSGASSSSSSVPDGGDAVASSKRVRLMARKKTLLARSRRILKGVEWTKRNSEKTLTMIDEKIERATETLEKRTNIYEDAVRRERERKKREKVLAKKRGKSVPVVEDVDIGTIDGGLSKKRSRRRRGGDYV